MSEHIIGKSYPWGCVDTLEIESSGLLRVNGWARGDPGNFSCHRVFVDGRELVLGSCYRTYRPDVSQGITSANFFQGFVFEYLIKAVNSQQISNIRIEFNEETILELSAPTILTLPHYEGLFSERSVLHRDQIYGFGPPEKLVAEEVLSLAVGLPGPLLDFGCGSGVLIKELRARGTESYGIELDRQPIVDSLYEETKTYVTLYDGNFPCAFVDKSFASVMCSEVLEHIPNFEAAVAEIARLAKEKVVFTVPDMTAIPLCHQHYIVPWHLLESTHVNFFTPNSLHALLKRFFPKVDIAKIGVHTVNGTRFYTSIVGICDSGSAHLSSA